MAIFKVLFLIGFVLLSSGYARQHQARHGPRFRQDYGFHRYKLILKSRLNADGISRQGRRRDGRGGEDSDSGNPRNARFAQGASTGDAEVRGKGNTNFSCLIIISVICEMNVFIATGSSSSYNNTGSIRNNSWWTS